LTGVHTGQVLSCEIRPFRAPTLCSEAEGNTEESVYSPALQRPCAVGDPEHV
jgi:hypothetical protein